MFGEILYIISHIERESNIDRFSLLAGICLNIACIAERRFFSLQHRSMRAGFYMNVFHDTPLNAFDMGVKMKGQRKAAFTD